MLVERARAALLVMDGREAEADSRRKDALKKYKDAISIFNGDPDSGVEGMGVDSRCREYLDEAQAAVARMELIEQSDENLRADLDKMEVDLQGLIDKIKARSEEVDKLQPVPEFKMIVDKLQGYLGQQTNLGASVQTLLSKTRVEWRNQYMTVVRYVLDNKAPELGVVDKAHALVDELQNEGLLSASKDRMDAIRLRILRNELAYAEMLEAKDWKVIERNRHDTVRLAEQARLLVSAWGDKAALAEAEQRQKDARSQQTLASRERVHAEINKRLDTRASDPLTSKDGNRAALEYLYQELDTTAFLRADFNLIFRLLKLFWNVQDWGGALAAVQKFVTENSDLPEREDLSEICRSLTRAAQAYAENDLEQAESYVAHLSSYESKKQLVAKANEDLRKETFDQLVQAAEAGMACKNDAGYLQAAECYAIACELQSGNAIVLQGLKRLGLLLLPGIQASVVQASQMRLGTRTVKEACQAAELLKKSLFGG